ncbi:MAG: ClpXP protease specificity-enhancing factor SspB [Parvularculaceae bacterium]
MKDVEIDYDFLTQQALKRVVRDVLVMTEELGAAPGDHHFYIEFETQADGVLIPEDLVVAYPARMTIVLQHQFDDLEVRDEEFAVTLWFKGRQARLTVPFEAVTSFADPSVQFGLRFDAAQREEPFENDAEPAAPESDAQPSAAVLQLDAFRKK